MKVIRSGFASIKEALSDSYFERRAIFERFNKGSLAWSRYWEYPWASLTTCKTGKVLDVGAGKSCFKKYLLEWGYNVTTIDPDPDTLMDTFGENLDQVVASAEAMPFNANYFDGVFCLSVLEHLPPDKIEKAMSEMERVLKPGGRLILTLDVNLDAKRLYHFNVSEFTNFASRYLNTFPPVVVSSDLLTSSLYYWEPVNNLTVFGVEFEKEYPAAL